MSLLDLSNDVLTILLAEAARYSGSSFRGFKVSLSLLAVCQRWRNIALPIVYADVHYMFWGEYFTEYRLDVRRLIARKPKYPWESTNAHLIASAGCINKVKRVHITLLCNEHPLPAMSVTVERLREAAAVWPQVEYVAFEHTAAYFGFQKEDVLASVDVFLDTFPGVRQLDVEGLPGSGDVNGLGNLLVAGYARQLRMYKGDPVALPPDCVLERLERATTTYWRGSDVSNQRMQPSTLQHLRLKTQDSANPLEMFVGGTNSDGGSIVFANLKSLRFICEKAEFTAVPAHYPTVHFPQLKSIELHYDTSTCGLLELAVFPTHMASFELCAPAAALEHFCTIELPAAEQVTVAVSPYDPEPEALVNVGRLLSRMRGGKQKLFITYAAARVLPELVSCTRLTCVIVHSQAEIGLVVAFAAKLPFLQRLGFGEVGIKRLPAAMSAARSGARKRPKPLNTSLQKLNLVFDRWCTAHDMVAAAKYLLVQLPNLDFLIAPGVPAEPVLDFVRESAPLYPHLQAVRTYFAGR